MSYRSHPIPTMNAPQNVFLRALPISALLCVSLLAQNTVPDPKILSILWDTPLSLPRFSHEAKRLGHTPIDRDSFEVLSLASGPHARKDARAGVRYIELKSGMEWLHNLRASRNHARYVSFTLNASYGTVIDVGGAAFVIGQSDRDTAYASIKPLGSGARINQEIPWLLFSGARMAPLNIITMKVDQRTNTWAIWFRDMLVADNIAIAPNARRGNQICITPGKGGAWLCGLVVSAENPLFEDANDNAIPDAFEMEILGSLLEDGASEQTLAALRAGWFEEKLMRPPVPFILNAPLPDSFPDYCDPNGEFIHGMTGGMKFGRDVENQTAIKQ